MDDKMLLAIIQDIMAKTIKAMSAYDSEYELVQIANDAIFKIKELNNDY